MESVMQIQITDHMKDIATAADSMVRRNVLKKHKNKTYTDLNPAAEGKYYYGYLGELIFMELMKLSNKHAEYRPKFDGTSDIGDVYLFTKDLVMVADIKTAPKLTHQYLMIPKVQFNKHPYSKYIAVRLGDSAGEVLGYAGADDLYLLEVRTLTIPTIGLMFTELKPIQNLIDILEDGPAVVDLHNLKRK